MRKLMCFWPVFLFLGLLFQAPMALCAPEVAHQPPAESDDPWVVLPAGARAAYMGIHGGTMPVSLLVANDGACLLSFVGCTGNDFLEALRQGPAPGDNMTRVSPRVGDFSLFAGNATSSMPVVALSGDILSGSAARLQPFGLSDEPLSIEGPVARPQIFPQLPPRRFSFTDWLFPNRKVGNGKEPR